MIKHQTNIYIYTEFHNTEHSQDLRSVFSSGMITMLHCLLWIIGK